MNGIRPGSPRDHGAVCTGAKHRLVFVDRLLAALVHLRHIATHDVPACWFGVNLQSGTDVPHPLVLQQDFDV
ncbi:transposase family protein [Streptomyces sp. NPDC002262]|uniref:transposase family protein n=1 Tax=Streptomyces sp. NPDC002262 TaxID=3154414 RepID=UPI00332C7003